MAISGVAVASVTTDVSMTAYYENGEWRFGAWTSARGKPIDVRPKPDHLAMRFATFESCADFFRCTYASQMTEENGTPR
jgi:hypothetical protein